MRLFARNRPSFGWYAYNPDVPEPHSRMQDAPLRLTVLPHETAVAYRHGTMVRALRPGRHFVGFGVQFRRVDMRDQRELLAPQDVPTADGALVRLTVSFGYRVTDPQAFVERSAQPLQEVYLAVQVGLREALIGREIEDVASAPRLDESIVADLTTRANAAASRVGLEVFDLVIKDIILPPEWRRAMLAVKTAKLQGLAKLEAARADTAALRALANQASVLEAHPELAKLQMVKAAAASGRLELTYSPFA